MAVQQAALAGADSKRLRQHAWRASRSAAHRVGLSLQCILKSSPMRTAQRYTPGWSGLEQQGVRTPGASSSADPPQSAQEAGLVCVNPQSLSRRKGELPRWSGLAPRGCYLSLSNLIANCARTLVRYIITQSHGVVDALSGSGRALYMCVVPGAHADACASLAADPGRTWALQVTRASCAETLSPGGA